MRIWTKPTKWIALTSTISPNSSSGKQLALADKARLKKTAVWLPLTDGSAQSFFQWFWANCYANHTLALLLLLLMLIPSRQQTTGIVRHLLHFNSRRVIRWENELAKCVCWCASCECVAGVHSLVVQIHTLGIRCCQPVSQSQTIPGGQ